MAKLIEKSEEVLTSALRLPKDSYKVRFTEEPNFRVSKNNNPMLVFEAELVEPATKIIDGQECKIGGLKFSVNCMLTGKGVFMLEDLHKAAKLPPPAELDTDSETGLPVGINYTGIEVWAVCSSEESTQKNEAGEPIMNPASGEPLTSNYRRIERFLFKK